MFALSILIGIYSYGIFTLGILGILTRNNIIGLTLSWLLITLFYFHDKIHLQLIKLDKKSGFILSLIITQSLVNLLGALGPEIGFDALWYHLTLPKIWLSEHLIRYLPGAVYKYSVMPKMLETLFAGVLSLGNEINAKLIHYLFGLFILIPLYGLSRKFLNRTYSLIVLLLFYSNLVVGWQSTTAYVDLARTFFEILALRLLFEDKIVKSAITLGLAISVKLIALGSLPIFVFLLIINKKSITGISRFIFFSLLVPLPWFLFAFVNTGNPVYPFLSPMYPLDNISLNLKDIWILFTQSPDPVSPVYIITAPLIFLTLRKKWSRGEVILFFYGLLAIFVWFITPRTGGGRFILPYLPALSVCSVFLIKSVKDLFLKKLLIFLTLTLALTSLAYRLLANSKYLPVLLGTETKQHFLTSRLNYAFGDYYDSRSKIASLVPSGEKVIVYGINNMFYTPDNFIHYTITRPGDNFNWLLIRYPDIRLPQKYSGWKIVYTDYLNKVNLLRRQL